MRLKPWADVAPGDVVLGRNGGTVVRVSPDAVPGTLFVHYEGGTSRHVRDLLKDAPLAGTDDPQETP